MRIVPSWKASGGLDRLCRQTYRRSAYYDMHTASRGQNSPLQAFLDLLHTCSTQLRERVSSSRHELLTKGPTYHFRLRSCDACTYPSASPTGVCKSRWKPAHFAREDLIGECVLSASALHVIWLLIFHAIRRICAFPTHHAHASRGHLDVSGLRSGTVYTQFPCLCSRAFGDRPIMLTVTRMVKMAAASDKAT